MSCFEVKHLMLDYIGPPRFTRHACFSIRISQHYDIKSGWHFHFFLKTPTMIPGHTLSFKARRNVSLNSWSTCGFVFPAIFSLLTAITLYNETTELSALNTFSSFRLVHLAYLSSYTREAALQTYANDH